MIRKLVVGADGSRASQHAIEWAADRAGESGAEVVAVLAVRPMGEFVMDVPPLPGHVVERRGALLEGIWCKPLRDGGVPYRTVVVEADPARGLLEVARREHADLLVVGAQGHGGLVQRILGGVTYKVAHCAGCAVVVVPDSGVCEAS
jgi:nucleotide-binding universal stress UspA family protein